MKSSIFLKKCFYCKQNFQVANKYDHGCGWCNVGICEKCKNKAIMQRGINGFFCSVDCLHRYIGFLEVFRKIEEKHREEKQRRQRKRGLYNFNDFVYNRFSPFPFLPCGQGLSPPNPCLAHIQKINDTIQKGGHMGQKMTLKEVAQYLNVCHRTIFRKIKEGKIPAYKEKRRWWFNRKDIEEFMKKGKQQ